MQKPLCNGHALKNATSDHRDVTPLLLCASNFRKTFSRDFCGAQVACLKTDTERGTRDLGHEEVALCEPVHIARKYFLRGLASIFLPCVLADQVPCKDLVAHGLENVENCFRRGDRGTIPGDRKA